MVGGPDVDARIELMNELRDEYELTAAGTSRDLTGRFEATPFPYEFYPMARGVRPFSDLRAVWRLIRLYRRLRPDLIHSFDTKPCVFARLAARFAGVPRIVGTIPGLGALYAKEGLATRVVRRVYESLQHRACRVSDMTVFQNPDDYEQYVSRGVVDAESAMIIPGSGVKTGELHRAQFTPEMRHALRDELGIPQDAVVITLVSRLIRSKGVIEYARAAETITREHPHARFLLVGPNDRESVDRLSEREASRVFAGTQWIGERRDVPLILAASDIFVLPSFYREGIPRVLLEAASMELPLVTTDSPGCNQAVLYEQNGFLVAPRDAGALTDAIRRLVVDAPLRERFGAMSRRIAVERFDLAVIARQTRELYDRVLRGMPPDSTGAPSSRARSAAAADGQSSPAGSSVT